MPPGVLGLWFLLAVMVNDWTTETMGQLGDAFAPLGTMLVFYGLLGAFSQQREDRKQAHLDRVEAHKDREIAVRNRVADAYARWFPIARAKLHEAERLIYAYNDASRQHDKDPDQLAKARQELPKIGALIGEVAFASTEVLLFEQDASLRERVQDLTRFPDLVTRVLAGIYTHHETVVALTSELTQRRKDVEKLVADVVTRLGGTPVAAVKIFKEGDTEVGEASETPAKEAER